MEGEGSTFGFFFKVRRSTETTEDGRPPPSRSNSESSNASARPETPGARPARPGYARANSNLQSIKERKNERPKPETITSHSGVDMEEVLPSLKDPPIEVRSESHPEAHEDERYKETERATKKVPNETPKIERRLPDLRRGETSRQEDGARAISRSQSDRRSEDRQTLLLVEDNLINQKVLRRQLQSRGFEVFTANNGQEAIDAVAERGQSANNGPNERNYFDCILMDQEMPIKDGNAATVEIRQLQEDGKAGYSHILGVSANVREAQTNSMREAGMDDVISKPFKVDDLVKKVRSLVLDSGGGVKHDNRPYGVAQKAKRKQKEEGKGGDGDADEKGEGDKKRESGSGSRSKARQHVRPRDDASRDGSNDKSMQDHEREGELRGGQRSRFRPTAKEEESTERQR
jgi:CheY-like chemotaxis protein